MYLFNVLKRMYDLPLGKLSKLGGWDYWEDGSFGDAEIDSEFKEVFEKMLE